MARGAPPVAGVVCIAGGLMEGFEGDRGGQHERDDDGGDRDEGLLAVHFMVVAVACLVPPGPFRQGQFRATATNKIPTLSQAPSP
jgi:hypothetical protein